MNAYRMPEPPLGRVLLVGAVHEAEPALHALLRAPVELVGVVTAPPDRAASMSGYVDLVPLAAAAGVPVRLTTDVNAAESLGWIRARRPDLVVVVGWSRLIGDELLALPPRGCIGFHASLLPQGCGRAPVNWAIIRGWTRTGNSMMYLAPGADTGDLVAQEAIPIGPEDDCGTVYRAVGEAGARMLATHLPGLLAGTAPRLAQQDDLATHLPKRTPAMGVTDWDRPTRAVHDWIRGQTVPYPGAFGTLAGRTVRLWRSRPVAGLVTDPAAGPVAAPGTVLRSGPDGLEVATADGALLLTQVGDDGGPPQPAADWARARGLHTGIGPGLRFDPVDPEVSRWALGLRPAPVPAATGVPA